MNVRETSGVVPAGEAWLSPEAIVREKARIEEACGKWTAHNVRLPLDVYTIGPGPCWAHHRGKWFGLVSEVLLRRPLASMRILDIGCLEGGVALALGESGGKVVGIDGRDTNLAKAIFARDVLGFSNVEFVEADMLSLQDYDLGTFDVIICAGTLYHVDAPDILPFLRSLRSMCSGIVIFDSHVSVELREKFVSDEGQAYYGRTFVETHHVTDDIEEKKKDVWGSLVNDLSFWPTERSLVNFLIDAGFEFVTQPVVPVVEWPWQDRNFWVGYSEIASLVSDQYPYAVGRLDDPSARPAYHEMLDAEVQRNSTNPATTRVSEDGSSVAAS